MVEESKKRWRGLKAKMSAFQPATFTVLLVLLFSRYSTALEIYAGGGPLHGGYSIDFCFHVEGKEVGGGGMVREGIEKMGASCVPIVSKKSNVEVNALLSFFFSISFAAHDCSPY